MRTRTYEIKDSTGKVIESGTEGWWNNQINLHNLAPNPTTGISGMVSARGGWCNIGESGWASPENPNTLQCSASRWAELVSARLIATGNSTPMGVIDAIAYTLEVLEDERNAPVVPTPVVEPPAE